jgi:hypothetical protein
MENMKLVRAKAREKEYGVQDGKWEPRDLERESSPGHKGE